MCNLLRLWGRALPDTKYVRSVATRVLRPLHNRFVLGKDTANALGFKMAPGPAECVDSALWFTPRHYDRDERRYVEKNAASGMLHESPIERITVMKSTRKAWSRMFSRISRKTSIRLTGRKVVSVKTMVCPDFPRRGGHMGYVRALPGRENHIYVRD